ncbi:MAG TPA: efflux RND transporter periplasmic adaptor subunit [bacterium]|nr:efflux RND transporter periplasmic adaptor subunit [bacterium]
MKGFKTITGGGLALLLFAGCSSAPKHAGGFKTVPVGRDDLQITVLATGNVQPQNQLAILPPIAGRIEKIFVREGDYVKKGQKLMELSSTERATLLDEAASKGPDELAHWEQLYQATPLLAPENGQIIYLPTVQGQIVSTGTSLMVMSDHLIVNTQVDETDLAQVKLGGDATIDLDAYPDQDIDAKVRRISFQSTLVNNVTTYEVDVWPDKVPAFMRSGMTANVTFNVAEKDDVLVVPSEAIQSTPDGQSFVLMAPAKSGDKPATQVIQTGITDGKETEITAGLKEGDKIVIKTFTAGQYSAASKGSNPFMPSVKGTGGGNRGGGGH